MKYSFFITINSFVGLPPVKQLLPIVSKNDKNICIQCNINGFENFFNQKNFINRSILNFESSKAFNSQSLSHKILKYLKLPILFLPAYFTRRASINYIYTIDLYSLLLALLFKSNLTKIIYLQYEMVETDKLSKLDSFFLQQIQKRSGEIDIIVTPEINRTEYLKNLFHNSKPQNFLTIPNTNNTSISKFDASTADSKTIVTHIGAVGLNHNIKTYLDAIANLDTSLYEFRFIGLLTNDVVELFKNYNKSNIIYIGQVLHNDLRKYYLETDIGVILYKDISLNHRFCAPNKLYEYWSYGIPVLGDKLPGLEGVFTETFLGELIDMDNPREIFNAITNLRKHKNRLVIATYFQSKLKLNNYLKDFSSRLEHI